MSDSINPDWLNVPADSCQRATLESREHRERGIDVGANAYIVKSSFDQSNLLDIIRRLI